MASNRQVVTATGAVTVTSTTEKVAVNNQQTTESNPGGEGMSIEGVINITPGSDATSVNVRVRAGVGITGTEVGVADAVTVTGSAPVSIPFSRLDISAAALSGQTQYSATVKQAGGTANGTVNQATISTQPATAAS